MSLTKRPSLRVCRPVQIDDLIRVGREYDGGYVLPRRVIERSQALLSLGVNDDWSFEEGVLDHNPQMRITCVDGTTSLRLVTSRAVRRVFDMLGHLLTLQLTRSVRDAKYLIKPLGFLRFFSRHELLPLMVGDRSTPGFVTLPELLQRVRSAADEWVIVKADIEGAEFDVLPGSASHLKKVSALLVEFHQLDQHWGRFIQCLSLLERDFHIAHVHGNNYADYIAGTAVPKTLEITLINRALVAGNPPLATSAYPRPGLDMPNNSKHPDLRLLFDDAA